MSCGLQEESPQSGKTIRRFTRLQFDQIGCHRGLVKSILNRLLHLGVTMSRRSSGGSDGITVNEHRILGLEVHSSRGGVSPPRLEHGDTLTAALVATFLVAYDSYKHTVRLEAGDGFERRPAELSKVVHFVYQEWKVSELDGSHTGEVVLY